MVPNSRFSWAFYWSCGHHVADKPDKVYKLFCEGLDKHVDKKYLPCDEKKGRLEFL